MAALESSLKRKRGFRAGLLRWYAANRRDLPWRRTKDPYRIWVSEIMLQQTRVNAVLEHYRRFLKRFPTVRSLAAASEADVLTAWSGLGYYRRARMMRQAAQAIVRTHGGRFPLSAEGLRELPGVGRYTAAAIASIAYGEPKAVVDGNVERVVERVAGRKVPQAETWSFVEAMIPEDAPGDFNQAMMELGALVCTPKAPKCGECPVRESCATRGRLQPATREVRKQAEIHFGLARRGKQVLLVQRDAGERLMAGMWELPRVGPNGKPPVMRLRHAITTTDYEVFVYEAGRATRGKWVAAALLDSLPLTGLARKILMRAGAFASAK